VDVLLVVTILHPCWFQYCDSLVVVVVVVVLMVMMMEWYNNDDEL
jgi:hypothetical protein